MLLPVQIQAVTLEQLIETIRKEGVQEHRHQEARLQRFLEHHQERQRLLKQLEAKVEAARARADALRSRFEANEKKLAELDQKWRQEAGDMEDLFTQARQNASAIKTMLAGSLVNAQKPGRLDFLAALTEPRHRATLADLRRLWDLLLDEIAEAGRVVRFQAPVIAPDGTEGKRAVVRVGVFNAFSGGHYLRYLAGSDRLLEPAQQPPARFRRLAAELEQAQQGWHPVALDPSRGALLALMIQQPDWRERLRQGGVIGYLILALGALGLLLALVRGLVLGRVARRIERQRRSDEPRPDNPLGRLQLALTRHNHGGEEALAVYLDELIQQESRRLYAGMTFLALLATISPLLGLLGTVTGMIETFDAIALFGTGDPKLMSGGISQALVTTQEGLAVAVPLLLIHSLLRSRADRLVAEVSQAGAELLERYSEADHG
ncbi:MotA/TolQ/ExbB proton channel family protein [Methylomarinovum caldicuralii]|nr:MotA/TolQ/ExbB proton channel family protein [Methylomarinovum caldicuralii]